MPEKETPEAVEEQYSEQVEEVEEVKAQEDTSEELEAAEETVEEAREEPEGASEEVQEESQELQASEEPVQEAAPPAPTQKKGLMKRRPSYSQSSVPNAHRGYSTNPPIVMLLIISALFLMSIIFATAAIN